MVGAPWRTVAQRFGEFNSPLAADIGIPARATSRDQAQRFRRFRHRAKCSTRYRLFIYAIRRIQRVARPGATLLR